MNLDELIKKYQKTSKMGLTESELTELLTKNFPQIDVASFWKEIGIVTVMLHEGQMLTYKRDILFALERILTNLNLERDTI